MRSSAHGAGSTWAELAGDLDEFRLVRPLGRGAMGEVYLGQDLILDRPVAIKLIRRGNGDPTAQERFLLEARSVARLSHPNVVTIYRVGRTHEGRPYLVQELVRGRRLDQLPRPLPWRRTCELGVGIARGLAAAHRKGVLHRDVKPSNVMVDESGVPRLLDFGLATLIGGPAVSAASPMPDRLVNALTSPTGLEETARRPANPSLAPRASPRPAPGTPRYMAPELWRGEPASVQSDIYALGVVLYELATGTWPYPQQELESLREAVLAGSAPPMSTLAPSVHRGLARIIDRCISKEPVHRSGGVDELVHELEQLLTDAPGLPDGNPYRGLRPFGAEHRGLFFGRGADVSALVDRLRSESLVVVTGDSGIGKSSVCHAGVVPAVVSGALDDGRAWRAIVRPPGRFPLSSLQTAVGLDLGDEPEAPRSWMRALQPPAGQGLLVVVDQLEELVTTSDPEEAGLFARLLSVVSDGVPGLKVLATLRGDLLTRLASFPELGGPMTRGLHLLRILGETDLEAAVVGPARAVGFQFESDSTVAELVGAVRSDPTALPLLQFALAALWERRDVEGARIPAGALDGIGGVAGALSGHADGLLHTLAAPEREAARRILVRLSTAQRTRAVRPFDELVPPDAPASAAALEALVRGRLVATRDTISGAGYALVHEALLGAWPTLRGWLDDEAGLRVVHERLTAAAGDWHRMGRPAEVLWSRRQLDETSALGELSAGERDFVAASRRRERWRRARLVVTVAALVAAAGGSWWGVRRAESTHRRAVVEAHLATAQAAQARGRASAQKASALFTRAFAAFDADESAGGEVAFAAARSAAASAHAGFRDAAAELEATLLVDEAQTTRLARAMAEVLYADALLAEAEFDDARVNELVRRLEAYDDGSYVAAWRAPGRLALQFPRAGSIRVLEYRPAEGDSGRLLAALLFERRSDALDVQLPPGSYLVIFDESLRFPVRLRRGETVRRELALPPGVPDGFVSVAGGRFLVGSADADGFRRSFLKAQPMHELESEAFFIARTEVTLGQYLEYLRALPPIERRWRLPRAGGAGAMSVELSEVSPGRFAFSLQPSTVAYRALEGQPLHFEGRTVHQTVTWEKLPVVGISWDDAHAYAGWLDDTGRVPGARLCTYREWERAARGADARPYPHGASLHPTDANFDETYQRVAAAYGPDEVGSYPAAQSPFGVFDLSGNVWEWVDKVGPLPIMKGGSWYQGASSALIANRDVGEVSLRGARIGMRVCASASPGRPRSTGSPAQLP